MCHTHREESTMCHSTGSGSGSCQQWPELCAWDGKVGRAVLAEFLFCYQTYDSVCSSDTHTHTHTHTHMYIHTHTHTHTHTHKSVHLHQIHQCVHSGSAGHPQSLGAVEWSAPCDRTRSVSPAPWFRRWPAHWLWPTPSTGPLKDITFTNFTWYVLDNAPNISYTVHVHIPNTLQIYHDVANSLPCIYSTL